MIWREAPTPNQNQSKKASSNSKQPAATMAGTRLVVHSIFVIELILLVGISFFYASNRRHDPSASAEPFLPDQSGWRIVVEDVSPSKEVDDADADGIVGIIAYAGECASMVVSQIQSLLGSSSSSDAAIQHDRTRRRSSAFVQEMRRLVATIHGADGLTATTQTRMSHPLKVILRTPQTILSHEVTNIGEALEKGLRQKPDLPRITVQPSSRLTVDIDACDDFHLPTLQSRQRSNHREVKHPEIFLLIGCTSATIPTQQMSSVEVVGNSDILIVRSKRTLDQINELLSDLENEISNQLLSRIFVSSSSENNFRLGKVFVNLIDENPASHVAGQSSIETKDRFNVIGNALSSSVQSVIGHFLEELSFIYGGSMEQIDGERVIHGIGKIGLEVHSTAYLPVPDDIIVKSVDEDDGHESTATPHNYVSSENLASWMHTHSRQAVRNANCLICRSDVEWTFFVPSTEHFPLMLRDDESGEVGESIILSQHPGQLDGGKTTNVPTGPGMSIVNLRSVGELFDSDTTGDDDFSRQLFQLYQDRISKSLVHLVGFLRASYGLPLYTTLNDAAGDGVRVQTPSFWELESIARSHYTSSLENALQQTDALFAVLHRHGRTLALPMDVAHKLNNATNLLRQSIALVEQGYPTIYATSLIHGSLQHLEFVQSDHRVYELPYFAIDHYLAVFSPLVLPLLLPMLAGFIREIKRYRELRKKKIEIV